MNESEVIAGVKKCLQDLIDCKDCIKNLPANFLSNLEFGIKLGKIILDRIQRYEEYSTQDIELLHESAKAFCKGSRILGGKCFDFQMNGVVPNLGSSDDFSLGIEHEIHYNTQ